MIRYYDVAEDVLADPSKWVILSDSFGFRRGRLIARPTFREAAAVTRPHPPPQEWFAARSLSFFTTGLPQLCTKPGPKRASFTLDERHFRPEWRSPTSIRIPHTPENLAAAIYPALAGDERIEIVDPYFSPDVGRRAHIATLKKIAELLQREAFERTVEIYCEQSSRKAERLTPNARASACKQRADDLTKAIVQNRAIPTGWTLKVSVYHRGEQAPTGKPVHMHNRFILGCSGGIGTCWGFNAINDGDDVIFVMSQELRDDVHQSIREYETDYSNMYYKANAVVMP